MAYSDYLSPEVIEPTIWTSLVAIEGQAVNLVPVDKGNLKGSITISTDKRKKQEGSSPDGMKFTPGTNQGAIGSAAEYAAAVEFGRPDMPNYPAQPYLRPALDQFRAKIGIITGAELAKQLKLYANRHPYKAEEIKA